MNKIYSWLNNILYSHVIMFFMQSLFVKVKDLHCEILPQNNHQEISDHSQEQFYQQ